MTNSRLTDPEILEFRFPVLLEDFHIREGSGGKGRWSAGDGTERTIRFLEEMDCAILSSHRDGAAARPRAAAKPGAVGMTRVRRARRHASRRCDGCDQTVLKAGRGGDRHHADRRRIWQAGAESTSEAASSPCRRAVET